MICEKNNEWTSDGDEDYFDDFDAHAYADVANGGVDADADADDAVADDDVDDDVDVDYLSRNSQGRRCVVFDFHAEMNKSSGCRMSDFCSSDHHPLNHRTIDWWCSFDFLYLSYPSD